MQCLHFVSCNFKWYQVKRPHCASACPGLPTMWAWIMFGPLGFDKWPCLVGWLWVGGDRRDASNWGGRDGTNRTINDWSYRSCCDHREKSFTIFSFRWSASKTFLNFAHFAAEQSSTSGCVDANTLFLAFKMLNIKQLDLSEVRLQTVADCSLIEQQNKVHVSEGTSILEDNFTNLLWCPLPWCWQWHH